MKSISKIDQISKCLNSPPDFQNKFIAFSEEEEPLDLSLFDKIWSQESMLKKYYFIFQPDIEKCFLLNETVPNQP